MNSLCSWLGSGCQVTRLSLLACSDGWILADKEFGKVNCQSLMLVGGSKFWFLMRRHYMLTVIGPHLRFARGSSQPWHLTYRFFPFSFGQNHLEQQGTGVRKVVFLVNQLALAQQQYEECAKYLSDFRIKLVTGTAGGATATEKVPLKHLLMRWRLAWKQRCLTKASSYQIKFFRKSFFKARLVKGDIEGHQCSAVIPFPEGHAVIDKDHLLGC